MIVEPVVFHKLILTDLNSVILNLVGGAVSHKLHTCIHWSLCSWKNKMCFVIFKFKTYACRLKYQGHSENHSPFTFSFHHIKLVTIVTYSLFIRS